MAKKTVKSEDEISLDNVLPAVDRKDINWWETLTSTQQKKFPAWLYMRYTSSVNGNSDLARYYLLATNERVNKKFSDLKGHDKLRYLLMTATSPGMGKQYHSFLPPPKLGKSNKKTLNLLEKLFPMSNAQELELLSELNDADALEKYLVSMGWPDKEIKAALSNKNADEE